MKSYGQVSSAFWTRGSGRRLRGDPKAQLVALYLTSAPTASSLGVYYLPLVTIANDTGIQVVEVAEALARLERAGFAHYDEERELVWIPNLAEFDIGPELAPGDRRRKKILSEVKAVGDHKFVREFWERYGAAYDLGSFPFAAVQSIPDAPSKTSNNRQMPPERNGMERNGTELELERKAVPGFEDGQTEVAAFAAGVQQATGAKAPPLLQWWDRRTLATIVTAQCPADVPDRAEWMRETAARFVRSNEARFVGNYDAKHFEKWIAAGMPNNRNANGSTASKGRGVQPVDPGKFSERPWEASK